MLRSRRLATTWFLFALLVAVVARSQAQRDDAVDDLDLARAVSRTQARAAGRVLPAVVAVRALSSEDEEFGAGIVVDGSGKVLTALHVVRAATTISVRLTDGIEFPAHLSASDPRADLALLSLSGVDRILPVAPWGRTGDLGPGASVLAVGNPFGLQGSVSRGIISATERRYVIRDNTVPLIQTDAALNPGSSGGALVSLEGEVVGMVTAILTTNGGGNHGIGFAVPAGEIRHALPYLLRGEPVQRAWIGIRARARAGEDDGLEITEVVGGGPADRAGVRSGDLLLRLHGIAIRNPGDLRAALRQAEVGERLRLGLERAGEILEIEVRAAHLREKT